MQARGSKCFTLKSLTGSVAVYSGVLHTGPSPVVSTEASPASPPSSFYPFCNFLSFRYFSRRFPTPFNELPLFFFLHSFHPPSRERLGRPASSRRRAASAGRRKTSIHDDDDDEEEAGCEYSNAHFDTSGITTVPAKTFLFFFAIFSMSASFYPRGLSSLVACTFAPLPCLFPCFHRLFSILVAANINRGWRWWWWCWRAPCPFLHAAHLDHISAGECDYWLLFLPHTHTHTHI